VSGAYTVLPNGLAVHWHWPTLDECSDQPCAKQKASKAQLDDFAEAIAKHKAER